MRNITVSVDEQTHRLARIHAAELDTSVSALVRDYLRSLAADPDPEGEAGSEAGETIYQRRCRLLREVLADFDSRGIGLRMSDNLTREALYDRGAAGAEAVAEQERQRSIPDGVGGTETPEAEAVAERERQRGVSEARGTSPCDS